jgi:AraC-like DNA-binding protein
MDSPGKVGPPPVAAVAQLAGAQWGVVSLEQLHELGVTRGAIDHWVRVGRLHRVYRGVYLLGHRAAGREARALAAVLACGPSAVLSHRSAAAWWGLLQTERAEVDVTAPRSRGKRRGVDVHRARALAAADITTHRGMPITTVARTLLEIAATERAHRLERALAQSERLRLYDHRTVLEVIARCNGHRGGPILSAAVAREPALTRNGLEALVLDVVRRNGLPHPMVNEALHVPDHTPIEPDFHWPAQRLIVETDGYETHGTRAAFDADRRRDAALQAAGYRVLRFTTRSTQSEIVARLQALLAQR